jgi:outer membrane protein assembly factor BamD
VIAASCVFGCTTTPEAEYTQRSVQELYNEAIDHVTEKEYELATSLFLEVERQHPYSVWAIKAQLMSSYAYYVRAH